MSCRACVRGCTQVGLVSYSFYFYPRVLTFIDVYDMTRVLNSHCTVDVPTNKFWILILMGARLKYLKYSSDLFKSFGTVFNDAIVDDSDGTLQVWHLERSYGVMKCKCVRGALESATPPLADFLDGSGVAKAISQGKNVAEKRQWRRKIKRYRYRRL